MTYLQGKLLLIIFCIMPSLNAGLISKFLIERLVEPVQLKKIQAKFELKKIRDLGILSSKDKPLTVNQVVLLYKKNLKLASTLTPSSTSLKILHHLEALDSEELFARMNKLASVLNIQVPDTEVREIALAFTFFLELRVSGEPLQKNLVKAIIDLFTTKKFMWKSLAGLGKFGTYYWLPIKIRSKPIEIPRRYWIILIANLTPKQILDLTMFVNKMSLKSLKTDLKSYFKLTFDKKEQGEELRLKKTIKKGNVNFENKALAVQEEILLYINIVKMISNNPNLDFLKIIQKLELLDSEKLFSYMNKLASDLNIRLPSTKVRKTTLAFTFYLKLRKFEELLRQN